MLSISPNITLIQTRILLLGLFSSILLAACGSSAQATNRRNDSPTGDINQGQELHTAYCVGCHSREQGKSSIGPPVVGLVSRSAETITSDDYKGKAETPAGYIRESIMEPGTYVVPGYPDGLMPNYSNTLSQDDLENLVSYLMTYQ